MNRHLRAAALLGLLAAPACRVFEDQSPENVSFHLSGTEGDTVQAVYSTEFIAGVTDEGVTQVRVFGADTVLQTLPIDTTLSIAENQQLFVEILPRDSVVVSVRVDIDGREVLEDRGFILPVSPWRYVYQFNQLLTQVVEVVI